MADIKNIISGTINSIVDKAKEVAENANVKETVKDIYEQGSSKVRSYSAIAKLSLELTGDKSELNKLYTEIGRLYFEETAEPDDFFAPLFEQAREIYERIAEKEALIGLLKDGDIISIDIPNRSITAELSEEEIAARRAVWQPTMQEIDGKWLKRYRKLATNASKGAVLE